MNSKNCRQKVERMVGSKIVPNRRVFVFMVGQEIEEKVEKYSQSGYCYSTIIYLKQIIHYQNESRKLLWEVECVDESKISLNQHVFVSIVGWEIEIKLRFKPPETSPMTISCVSGTECQIYIYVENVLRSTQTRVISNLDVAFYIP